MIESALRSIVRQFLLYLANKVGEPIVKSSVRPDLRQAMPSIYEDLDRKMVGLLSSAGPVAMTTAISQAIESRIDRSADYADIRAVVRDYSPIMAVLKKVSRP